MIIPSQLEYANQILSLPLWNVKSVILEKPRAPIDCQAFSCYNNMHLIQKEAAGMGERANKQYMSIGLLAHV